jgi:membrane protease YdiL (CAAX protease family)
MLWLEDPNSATDAPVALDHVFFVALALLSPLVDRVWHYPRLVRATQAGHPRARSRFYVSGILTLWGLTACALALWIARGRGWSSLRLGSGTPLRLGLGLALAGILVALLRSQRRAILSRPAAIDRVRGLFGTAGPLLPRTASELRGFAWLSITAGVCEETLFRG